MVAPWMEPGSLWHDHAVESVWRDDFPARESLRRAERSGDSRKLDRAEARLRKITETRAARVEAQAREFYRRDAEAGANGAVVEALERGVIDHGPARGARGKVSELLKGGG